MKNGYPLPLIKALPSCSKCQFRQEEVRFIGYVRSKHIALTFKDPLGATSLMLRTSSSMSAIRITVKYDEVDGVGKPVKKLLKVEELSWSPKASKV